MHGVEYSVMHSVECRVMHSVECRVIHSMEYRVMQGALSCVLMVGSSPTNLPKVVGGRQFLNSEP